MKIRRIILLTAALTLILTASCFATEQDGWLVQLDSDAGKISSPLAENITPVSGFDGLYCVESIEDLNELKEEGLIEYIEPNYVLELLGEAPDDPCYSEQWTLSAVHADALRSAGYDGSGVTVAVIDSGLHKDHEDFEGLNISSFSRNFLGNGAFPEAWDRDQTGHGTFVTSQIAAVTGNGKGLASIAPGAEIMMLRCFSKGLDSAYDSNSGTVAVVAEAIRYAADNGADVLNMSLGGAGVDTVTLQNAVSYANAQGVVVIASVGNYGGTVPCYPAACDGVIGVGSVRSDGGRSSFSQHNSSVDVVAPGEQVTGINIYPKDKAYTEETVDQTYAKGDGTSYSAPVVSAAAAIMKQINPALDGEDFLNLLMATSTDKGATGRDNDFGYGLLNCEALLEALTETDYTISYSVPADVTVPTGAAVTYRLNRADVIALPQPERAGYTFDGWFDGEDDGAVKMTGLGLDHLAPAVVTGGGIYVISDTVLYSHWSDNRIAGIKTLKYGGFDAVPVNDDPDCTEYRVLVDSSDYGEIIYTSPDKLQLTVEPVYEGAREENEQVFPEISPSAGEERGITFDIVNNTVRVSYRLVIEQSPYKKPALLTDDVQQGEAYFAPADGHSAATPYKAKLTDWFSAAENYEAVSCDGEGTVSFDAGYMTYEPGGGDAVGDVIHITVRAYNTDFAPAGCRVSAEVKIKRQASVSTVTPSTISCDIYTDDSLELAMTLYDNSLTGIKLDGNIIAASDYIIGSSEELSDKVSVKFTENWVKSLTTGLRMLEFDFSGGGDQVVEVNVEDSAPRYDAEFYLEKGEAVYSAKNDIREGSTLGTLPAATREGKTLLGWYTDLSNPLSRVTKDTVVMSDLKIYASWKDDAGSGGGGGGGAGGGGGGGGGFAPSEPEELPPEELPPEEPEEELIATPAAIEFSDTEGHWAEPFIDYCSSRGIFNGVGDGRFAPEAKVTRAMFVTALWNLAGAPEPENACGFTDVPETAWYVKAVAWGAENGLVSGFGSGRFAPDEDVTREQMCIFMKKYLDFCGYELAAGESKDFEDGGDIHDWAESFVDYCSSLGLISGYSDGSFKPLGNASRAECCAVFYNMISKIEELAE